MVMIGKVLTITLNSGHGNNMNNCNFKFVINYTLQVNFKLAEHYQVHRCRRAPKNERF